MKNSISCMLFYTTRGLGILGINEEASWGGGSEYPLSDRIPLTFGLDPVVCILIIPLWYPGISISNILYAVNFFLRGSRTPKILQPNMISSSGNGWRKQGRSLKIVTWLNSFCWRVTWRLLWGKFPLADTFLSPLSTFYT